MVESLGKVKCIWNKYLEIDGKKVWTMNSNAPHIVNE